MSSYTPQLPLSRPKLVLNIALFVLGTGLLIWLSQQGLIDNGRTVSILVGLVTTLFALSLPELFPEAARRIEELSKRGKFRRFFGEAVLKTEVRLVYASRQLSQAQSESPWVTHYRVPEDQGKPVAEGVGSWLAFEDIRAATALANEVHDMTGKRVKFVLDRLVDDDDFDFCAISLGLGFNAFTHRLAAQCEGCLFGVKWGKSPKTTFVSLTDLITVAGELLPDPASETDLCIVARVVSYGGFDKPPRVSFVCAGRTAAGTAVAGYFLAHKWPALMKMYDDQGKNLSADSLVVVVQHTADERTGQEHDSSGRIFQPGGQPLVHWAKSAGV